MAQGTPSYANATYHMTSHIPQGAQNHHHHQSTTNQQHHPNQNSSQTPPININNHETNQQTHNQQNMTPHRSHSTPNYHAYHYNRTFTSNHNYYRGTPNNSSNYGRPNHIQMHKPANRNQTPSPAYATGAPAQFRVPQQPLTTYVYPSSRNIHRGAPATPVYNQKCDNNHCRTWSKKRRSYNTDTGSISSLRTDSNSSASAVDENLNEKKEGNGNVSPPPTPYSPMVNMEQSQAGLTSLPPAQNSGLNYNHEVGCMNFDNNYIFELNYQGNC